MISIAQAFRVWKQTFASQKGYPFPPEAKWLFRWLYIGALIWPLVFIFGTLVVVEGWPSVTASFATADWPSVSVNFGAAADFTRSLLLTIPLAIVLFAPLWYAAAVFNHWVNVGHDRWLNEGRMCRSCGSEGARAHTVNFHDQVTRFRADRKEYDRLQRARRLGKRGRIVADA